MMNDPAAKIRIRSSKASAPRGRIFPLKPIRIGTAPKSTRCGRPATKRVAGQAEAGESEGT